MKYKYRCPVCQAAADIDPEKKTVSVYLPRGTRNFPAIGHACELTKPIDEIDLSKLEKVQ